MNSHEPHQEHQTARRHRLTDEYADFAAKREERERVEPNDSSIALPPEPDHHWTVVFAILRRDLEAYRWRADAVRQKEEWWSRPHFDAEHQAVFAEVADFFAGLLVRVNNVLSKEERS